MSLKATHAAIYADWIKRHPQPPAEPSPTNTASAAPKDRYKNTWERQYGQHLALRLQAGDIRQFEYESIKFRLAGARTKKDGSTEDVIYTPDFVIWLPDDVQEIHEIKGHRRKAELLRFQMAREKFTGYTWRMLEKKCGRWVELNV